LIITLISFFSPFFASRTIPLFQKKLSFPRFFPPFNALPSCLLFREKHPFCFISFSLCVNIIGGGSRERKKNKNKKTEEEVEKEGRRGGPTRRSRSATISLSLSTSLFSLSLFFEEFELAPRFQPTMLASTAPLRTASSSMPRAVARPAGLTVEAKWKVH